MPTEHANFVLQQYRASESKDELIRARFGPVGSREIAFDTNLSKDAADALALKIKERNVNPLVFELEIEDLMDFAMFIDSPPQFALTLTERNIIEYPVIVIFAEMDLNTGMSKIEVRG